MGLHSRRRIHRELQRHSGGAGATRLGLELGSELGRGTRDIVGLGVEAPVLDLETLVLVLGLVFVLGLVLGLGLELGSGVK